jgi:hypothetical protein
MSLIRLFIDEDSMERQFVRALGARGVDVTTVGEIGTTSIQKSVVYNTNFLCTRGL